MKILIKKIQHIKELIVSKIKQIIYKLKMNKKKNYNQ